MDAIVKEEIERVVRESGSIRKAADALKVSTQYLYDVKRNKRKAGPKILKALGIVKVVAFQRREEQ